MEHYVGLDVSLKLTAICIVDRACCSRWQRRPPILVWRLGSLKLPLI